MKNEIEQAKQTMKDMEKIIPEAVRLLKILFDELIKQGFTREEAISLLKSEPFKGIL